MSSLREVSRQAVRDRIAEAAEALIAAKGFQETTVDEIAAAVGMSQRSFFRYFAYKEDVVLEKYDRQGDELLAQLVTRPLEEPEWDTLRTCFDVVVDRLAAEGPRCRETVLQQIIQSNPALLAAHLERVNRFQEDLAENLAARALAREPDSRPDTVVLRALVGSAFACLQAALTHTLRNDEVARLGDHLDRTMHALRPLGDPGPLRTEPAAGPVLAADGGRRTG